MAIKFERYGVTRELEVAGAALRMLTGPGRFDEVLEDYATAEDAQQAAEVVQAEWERLGFSTGTVRRGLTLGSEAPAKSPLLLDSSGQPFRKPATTRPRPVRTEYPKARDLAPKLVTLLKRLDREADWFEPELVAGQLVGAAIDAANVAAVLVETLRRLAIVITPADDELQDAVAALLKKPPAALESLSLAQFHKTLEVFLDSELDPTQLLAKLPRLRELELGAGTVRLGAFDLPALRSLRIRSTALPRETLAAIGDRDRPALEELELWFGAGTTCTVADLAPLFELPALRRLAIKTCTFADELCEPLRASRLWAQLSVLELSYAPLAERNVELLRRESLQLITNEIATDSVEHWIPVGPGDQFIELLNP